MQSTASAAGYSHWQHAHLCFCAYIIINGTPLSLPLTLAWVFCSSAPGSDHGSTDETQYDQPRSTPVPSGVAAAETLHALYSHGAKGMRAARASASPGSWRRSTNSGSMVSGVLSRKLCRTPGIERLVQRQLVSRLSDSCWASNGWAARSSSVGLHFRRRGRDHRHARLRQHADQRHALLDGICSHTATPRGDDGSGFKDGVQGTPLVRHILHGNCRSAAILHAMAYGLQRVPGLGKMFSRNQPALTEMEAIETPISWFVIGQLISLIALAWLAHLSFAMPLWQKRLAVVLSSAWRWWRAGSTGETDTTPLGPTGEGDSTDLWSAEPGEHEREPDEREHYLERRDFIRRPVD